MKLGVTESAKVGPRKVKLVEKGIITQQEFLQKIAEERATYQKLLKPTVQ